MAELKKCADCGHEKPLSEFHRYTGKTARSPDGYRAVCIDCRCAAERKRYYDRKRQRLVEAARQNKA